MPPNRFITGGDPYDACSQPYYCQSTEKIPGIVLEEKKSSNDSWEFVPSESKGTTPQLGGITTDEPLEIETQSVISLDADYSDGESSKATIIPSDPKATTSQSGGITAKDPLVNEPELGPTSGTAKSKRKSVRFSGVADNEPQIGDDNHMDIFKKITYFLETSMMPFVSVDAEEYAKNVIELGLAVNTAVKNG